MDRWLLGLFPDKLRSFNEGFSLLMKTMIVFPLENILVLVPSVPSFILHNYVPEKGVCISSNYTLGTLRLYNGYHVAPSRYLSHKASCVVRSIHDDDDSPQQLKEPDTHRCRRTIFTAFSESWSLPPAFDILLWAIYSVNGRRQHDNMTGVT